jgi:hypothetical protein
MKVASSLYVTMYWMFFRKHRCNRRSEGVEYRATVMGGGVKRPQSSVARAQSRLPKSAGGAGSRIRRGRGWAFLWALCRLYGTGTPPEGRPGGRGQEGGFPGATGRTASRPDRRGPVMQVAALHCAGQPGTSRVCRREAVMSTHFKFDGHAMPFISNIVDPIMPTTGPLPSGNRSLSKESAAPLRQRQC